MQYDINILQILRLVLSCKRGLGHRLHPDVLIGPPCLPRAACQRRSEDGAVISTTTLSHDLLPFRRETELRFGLGVKACDLRGYEEM